MTNPLKRLFYMKIDGELADCKRILDLGCGGSSLMERLSGDYYSVGVDAFKPYLDESKRKNAHNEYVLADILNVDFPEKSFDGLICCQVIEHITTGEGLALIEKMNRWTKKRILITTPNGFFPQGKFDDNDLQEHKSGWTPEELRALGFRVRGYAGLKIFAHSENVFVKGLWYLSFPFVWFAPGVAWQLLAIKTV